MKPVETMAPAEYLEFVWTEFNQTVGGSDLARWRNPADVTSIHFPLDHLLAPADILDRNAAFANSVMKHRGIEGMWRDAVGAPIRAVMSDHDKRLAEGTLVALFPTFSVDASLKPTPRGDRIILLHIALTRHSRNQTGNRFMMPAWASNF